MEAGVDGKDAAEAVVRLPPIRVTVCVHSSLGSIISFLCAGRLLQQTVGSLITICLEESGVSAAVRLHLSGSMTGNWFSPK
jgi:hypothetical protein